MDDKNQDRGNRQGQGGGSMGSKGGQSGNMNPAQMQQYLRGVDYPASKDDIISKARSNGADDSVINKLNSLPDQQFETAADVSRAVGQNE